jgi:hypothetical protein
MARAVVGLDGLDGEWEGMVEVTVEHEFEYNAERLWSVLADFGNIDWVPGFEQVELEGEGVGMIRHITVPVFPSFGAKS